MLPQTCLIGAKPRLWVLSPRRAEACRSWMSRMRTVCASERNARVTGIRDCLGQADEDESSWGEEGAGSAPSALPRPHIGARRVAGSAVRLAAPARNGQMPQHRAGGERPTLHAQGTPHSPRPGRPSAEINPARAGTTSGIGHGCRRSRGQPRNPRGPRGPGRRERPRPGTNPARAGTTRTRRARRSPRGDQPRTPRDHSC